MEYTINIDNISNSQESFESNSVIYNIYNKLTKFSLAKVILKRLDKVLDKKHTQFINQLNHLEKYNSNLLSKKSNWSIEDYKEVLKIVKKNTKLLEDLYEKLCKSETHRLKDKKVAMKKGLNSMYNLESKLHIKINKGYNPKIDAGLKEVVSSLHTLN